MMEKIKVTGKIINIEYNHKEFGNVTIDVNDFNLPITLLMTGINQNDIGKEVIITIEEK